MLTRPFILGVCGPTGSGKSTLAKMLSVQPNVGLVQEPIPQRLLDAFAKSPIEFGWKLQKEILSAKAVTGQKVRGFNVMIFDRIIEEDREVFLNLHHALGFLSSRQLNNLRNYSSKIELLIGKPHAVIYVTAQPDTLRTRMLQDGRPEWLVAALDLQLKFYEKFEKNLKGPCLRMDTTHLNMTDLVDIASWINATMMNAYYGSSSENERFNIHWECEALN